MKTKLASIFAGVLLLAGFIASALYAAEAPAPGVPVVTDSLTIIQAAPASGKVQAFWQKATTLDGQTYTQPLVENSWPIGDTGEVEITLADGKKAMTTRAAVFAAVVAIATQEHAKPAP